MGTKVAWEMPGLQTFVSAHNMSAWVGRVVAMSANGLVFASGAAKTSILLGICVDGGFSAGSQVAVACCPGMIVQGESVAAINEGARCTVSDGAKVASAAVGSTTHNFGRALTAATASGQLVKILLTGPTGLYTK